MSFPLLWSRLRSWVQALFALGAPATDPALDLKNPRTWLDDALACKKQGDAAGAVAAFRTAALLFWDARKGPQARASLKLAIELSPRDQYLLAELKAFQNEDGPTLPKPKAPRMVLTPVPAVVEPTFADDEVPLPDFARPTVVDLELLGLRPR